MLNRAARKQRAREYVERRLGFHDYDDLADVLRGLEQTLPWAPSRSTFYSWVKQWREARARDRSGAWSLLNDETGRPDIVMRVIAALIGQSRGRHRPTVTSAEAHWIVRLALAVPDILADQTQYRQVIGVDPEPVAATIPGALNLWAEALSYVEAESAADTNRLAELDRRVALCYAEGGRHFVATVDPLLLADMVRPAAEPTPLPEEY